MHHPRQDNTYHDLCYTNLGALGKTRGIKLKTKNVTFKDILVHVVCLIGIKLKTKNVSFKNGRKEGNVLFNDTLNEI